MISLHTYFFFYFVAFQFSLADFATSWATASQIFYLFWLAVCISELNELKVFAFTCDGASSK